VGKLFSDTGVITLISFISPYRVDRQKVRDTVVGPCNMLQPETLNPKPKP